ncbi:hypothetical protein VMCG_10153 [Cytospora schulzeri]|uniref:Uncharacterized protein n=1 Tax=Cytospora schulzeri TaxID=448051 RepID=A0A423VDE5_9PEZI|nr:hypothetical protein VMCG_10153 [Valsa malicola]
MPGYRAVGLWRMSQGPMRSELAGCSNAFYDQQRVHERDEWRKVAIDHIYYINRINRDGIRDHASTSSPTASEARKSTTDLCGVLLKVAFGLMVAVLRLQSYW